MSSKTLAVCLLSLVAALIRGFETQASTGQWFVARSDMAVAIAREQSPAQRLLLALTMVRSTMQRVAGVDLPLPVRVLAMKNEAQLRDVVPQYWERRGVRPAGASYAGPHAAFIAIRTNIPAAQEIPLLLHEYTHLLTSKLVPEAPGWLDEGLSEFWAAIVFDNQRVVVGRPPAQHLKLLRTREWLSLDRMNGHQRGKLATDQDEAMMFYAQSWAMTHYLLLGRDRDSSLPFAPSQREWTSQLDAAIRAYIVAGRFREVTIPQNFVVASTGDASPVSEARALAEQANMVVFGERPDAALLLARRSLALDPREPLALEVIGTYHFLQNDSEEAQRWLARALEADPKSHAAALYLALLSQSAQDRERYLTAAVVAKPDLAVAWHRLWALYVEDGRADQMSRVCDQVTSLLKPWWWLDQPLRCDAQDHR